jgi:hypothetical protein
MQIIRKPIAVAAALAMFCIDLTNVGRVSVFAGVDFRF